MRRMVTVLLFTFGLLLGVATPTAFGDTHSCWNMVCNFCSSETCEGDFSFRYGCECHITCYNWPPPPETEWIYQGEAVCRVIEG
jgi:hypothetical protein